MEADGCWQQPACGKWVEGLTLGIEERIGSVGHLIRFGLLNATHLSLLSRSSIALRSAASKVARDWCKARRRVRHVWTKQGQRTVPRRYTQIMGHMDYPSCEAILRRTEIFQCPLPIYRLVDIGSGCFVSGDQGGHLIRWTAHNCQFEDNGASLLHGACTKSGDPLFCILRGRGDFAEQLIAFDSFCSPCVVRLCNRLSSNQQHKPIVQLNSQQLRH